MRTIRFCFVLAIVCLLTSIISLAQAGTGSIAGTVTDATGAVVEGAEITVRNTATNETHQTTSTATGGYSVTSIPVGPYEVRVKKEGFKLFRQPSIELTVAQTFTVDAKLTPGAAGEEVTVRADRMQDVDLETS